MLVLLDLGWLSSIKLIKKPILGGKNEDHINEDIDEESVETVEKIIKVKANRPRSITLNEKKIHSPSTSVSESGKSLRWDNAEEIKKEIHEVKEFYERRFQMLNPIFEKANISIGDAVDALCKLTSEMNQEIKELERQLEELAKWDG